MYQVLLWTPTMEVKMFNLGTILATFMSIGLSFGTNNIESEAVDIGRDYSLSCVVETEMEVEEESQLFTLMEEGPVEYSITEEEIELIALVTMAEAEGETELGKRLVIDTILNRVDSELGYMPDTVTEVIYQPDQFSSMWNGRVDDCYVTEEIRQLVREEIESRTNYDVLYFHAKKYGKFGTPMFSEGNHYFSK